MSFQFTCPQGHLLEGDPAHAGMQSQCPMCGAMFIIPQAPAAAFPAGAPVETPSSGADMFSMNNLIPHLGPPPEEPAGAVAEPVASAAEPVAEPIAAPVQEDPDPLVHILCPNGHELETPMSMVGSDAMCPHCQVAFRLRYEDSKEYIEKKQKERERREAAFGKKALQFAIIAAAVILLSLLGLMLLGGRR